MKDDLTVCALQRQTDALGNHEDNRWNDNQTEACEPHDFVNRQMEVRCHDVVTTIEKRDENKRERHCANSGAVWVVTRAIQQVVLTLIASHPRLNKWIEC